MNILYNKIILFLYNTPKIGVHSTYEVMYRNYLRVKNTSDLAIAMNSQSQQMEWMIMLVASGESNTIRPRRMSRTNPAQTISSVL